MHLTENGKAACKDWLKSGTDFSASKFTVEEVPAMTASEDEKQDHWKNTLARHFPKTAKQCAGVSE